MFFEKVSTLERKNLLRSEAYNFDRIAYPWKCMYSPTYNNEKRERDRFIKKKKKKKKNRGFRTRNLPRGRWTRSRMGAVSVAAEN